MQSVSGCRNSLGLALLQLQGWLCRTITCWDAMGCRKGMGWAEGTSSHVHQDEDVRLRLQGLVNLNRVGVLQRCMERHLIEQRVADGEGRDLWKWAVVSCGTGQGGLRATAGVAALLDHAGDGDNWCCC